MTKKPIRVNERGIRIGESHPNARLSDVEVELLLGDRLYGNMSLGALATKWGLSKSGVKKICDGTCRGQVGPRKVAFETAKPKLPKVRVKLSVPITVRAKIHRLGGAAWVEKVVKDEKEPAKKPGEAEIRLSLPLHVRAKLYRLGFSEWLREVVSKHDPSVR